LKPLAETSMPTHRLIALTWDGEREARRRLLNSSFCGLCNKLALRTETDARSYIGLLLANPRRRPHADEFALTPFPCPHVKDTWHVGRNFQTAQLVKGANHDRRKDQGGCVAGDDL
jgi:hypothetical protein